MHLNSPVGWASWLRWKTSTERLTEEGAGGYRAEPHFHVTIIAMIPNDARVCAVLYSYMYCSYGYGSRVRIMVAPAGQGCYQGP